MGSTALGPESKSLRSYIRLHTNEHIAEDDWSRFVADPEKVRVVKYLMIVGNSSLPLGSMAPPSYRSSEN
jgi:hypothetical protein